LSTDSHDLVPLILAGGRGTRIAHLCSDLPKPAVPVHGRPFLAWLLRALAKGGFRQVVVSSGYRAAELRREVEPWVPPGMEIHWVEEKLPLGTGGGAAWAARCAKFKPANWLVMNGDSVLAGKWLEKILCRRGAVLVAREVPDTSRYGRLEQKNGRLAGFSEKASEGPGWINAGIYRIPASWLNEVPNGAAASLETDFLASWLREGREIAVLEETGAFLDIGTPESLAQADPFVRQHLD